MVILWWFYGTSRISHHSVVILWYVLNPPIFGWILVWLAQSLQNLSEFASSPPRRTFLANWPQAEGRETTQERHLHSFAHWNKLGKSLSIGFFVCSKAATGCWMLLAQRLFRHRTMEAACDLVAPSYSPTIHVGLSIKGSTPGHHPFLDRIFPNKNHLAVKGYPHFLSWKPPQKGNKTTILNHSPYKSP